MVGVSLSAVGSCWCCNVGFGDGAALAVVAVAVAGSCFAVSGVDEAAVGLNAVGSG